MKVFISPTAAIGRGVEVFQNTLEESGITVVNPFLCKSFKEVKESFDTCDAMITFLCHQYAITSYTGDTVLSDAINKGMPVILIKEFPKQDRVGSLLID